MVVSQLLGVSGRSFIFVVVLVHGELLWKSKTPELARYCAKVALLSCFDYNIGKTPTLLSGGVQMSVAICNLLISLSLFVAGHGFAADIAGELSRYQQALRLAGEDMLENLEVSYVYGGNKVGDSQTCDTCNRCLESKRPAPKERFKLCSVCTGCSLDCSHFVQLVFNRANLGFPYLTSTQMLDLDASALLNKYNLRPVSISADGLLAGDLLVYRGHVVIVETVHSSESADIVHATGGKDIRLPGQGIQRERFVRVGHFRGELLRVLRHVTMDQLWRSSKGATRNASSRTLDSSPNESQPAKRFKMRRVEKQTDAAPVR
jgi:hypothetical protein